MLTSWILSLMLVLQPKAPWSDTYAATASAIDQAVQEQGSVFGDDDEGRAKTAALLVSLAWFESTFRPNAVGGRGRLHGLYQTGGKAADLNDPLKASRLALEHVRESFRLCSARPAVDRLVIYAIGGTTCKEATADALGKSRARVSKAVWLMKHYPPQAESPSEDP
jgi:hypothetical protein